jgi:hypothetical protein
MYASTLPLFALLSSVRNQSSLIDRGSRRTTKIGYFCVDLTCAFGVSFCAPPCASPGVTPCEGPRVQVSRTKVYHSQFISRTGVVPDARR